MPTIIIQGRQVQVGDNFFTLSPEEQRATIDRNVTTMTAGDNGEQQPRHSWSEVPGYLVPSAIDQVTGAIDMFMHPEPYIDAAQGTIDRIIPPTVTNFMDTYVSPRSSETRERQREISE